MTAHDLRVTLTADTDSIHWAMIHTEICVESLLNKAEKLAKSSSAPLLDIANTFTTEAKRRLGQGSRSDI